MNIRRVCRLSGVGHRLNQYLHGELAGLLVLNNHTEADHIIQCINSCEQKLDFHAINEMETGMVSEQCRYLCKKDHMALADHPEKNTILRHWYCCRE